MLLLMNDALVASDISFSQVVIFRCTVKLSTVVQQGIYTYIRLLNDLGYLPIKYALSDST